MVVIIITKGSQGKEMKMLDIPVGGLLGGIITIIVGIILLIWPRIVAAVIGIYLIIIGVIAILSSIG